jgi:hypothetical protein
VDYWNNIDGELELDMDVLDDHEGEAKEVYSANNWLTYGEALHRLREFGVTMKEMDLIDEARLSAVQMKRMVEVLLGFNKGELVDPQLDWTAFKKQIIERTKQEPPTWDPVTKRNASWILANKLHARNFVQGQAGCSIS